jgi:septal ring factor EnvC (AmiA/AmiB activator)
MDTIIKNISPIFWVVLGVIVFAAVMLFLFRHSIKLKYLRSQLNIKRLDYKNAILRENIDKSNKDIRKHIEETDKLTDEICAIHRGIDDIEKQKKRRQNDINKAKTWDDLENS